MSDVLSIEALLDAQRAIVYRALTSPAAMRSWLAEHAEVDLRTNTYAFWGRHTPQGDRRRQQLLAYERDSALSFSWSLDDRPTTVRLCLSAGVDGRTALRLHQDGQPSMDELMAPSGRRDGLHSMHTFWPLALANLAEYVEERPQTPKADFSRTRSNEIRAEFDINAPRGQVFASLLDPVQIERWFGWKAEVEPRIGGTITVGVDGKIFELDPDRRLVYADAEGAIVHWELADSDGQTHLTFVQSGYSTDEWDNTAQHEAGWFAALAELTRMHELGAAWTPLTRELPDDTDAN